MPSEYGEREPEDKRRRGRVCRRVRKSAEAIPSYLHHFTLCSHRYEELQRAYKGASYERRGEPSPFSHCPRLSSVSYLRLVHAPKVPLPPRACYSLLRVRRPCSGCTTHPIFGITLNTHLRERPQSSARPAQTLCSQQCHNITVFRRLLRRQGTVAPRP